MSTAEAPSPTAPRPRVAAVSPSSFAWRRAWALVALSLAVVVLAAVGVVPTWPGLLHLVALPPLDLFTDLRLIIVQASSWPVAVTVLAAVLALRVTLTAYLMGPLNRANLGLAVRFYALLGVPLTVVAAVVSAAAAMPHSYIFWLGLGVLAPLLLFAAVPWRGTARLRTAVSRTWSQGLRLEVLIPYFIAVVALGVTAQAAVGLTLPLVPVSALATGLALHFLRRPPVRRPGLLGAVAATVALAILGGLWATRQLEPSIQEAPRQEGSLLVMEGIDSASGRGTVLRTEPERLGYACDQLHYFSYAGAGDGQPRGHAECPSTTGAPYEREDTQRPIDELVEVFAAQTEDLPRPLVVAGHSNAAWVAWEAVARGEAEVDALVLLGPMPDSPVGYPPPGENGTGRVLGDLLRLVTPAASLIDYEPSPDAPQARELQAVPNASREIFSRPLPEDVRALSMMAARDLAIMPGGWRLDVERNACPARVSHADLPITAEYTEEFIRFFDGQPAPECPAWQDWGPTMALPFGAAADAG